MYKIKLLNKISPVGLERLPQSKYRCADDVEQPDGIILRSASMHEMELPTSVRGIARAGAGVNNIPVDRFSQQGVVVFNTPGGNANAVKELVLAGLLLSARKIVPAMQWLQEQKEQPELGKLVEKGKSKFAGPELAGKKLGVVGLGAIGILVCNAAVHLGMEVYGYDPYLSVNAALQLSRAVHKVDTLKEIYAGSDFISLHLPATGETKGMINSQSIAMMKHGVRLLNFSRGELVDTEELLEAVEEKRISCYVTDFASKEMLGHPGILCMPHLGASTPESEDVCAAMAATQLAEFLETGNIKNAVNLPDVHADKGTGPRVTIFHQNIPNMIAQITGAFSGEGINISNLTNKSKGGYAYTLVDADEPVSAELIQKLRDITGTVRVTLIP